MPHMLLQYVAMLWQGSAIDIGERRASARFLSTTTGILALSPIPLYTNCLSVTLSQGNREAPIEDYEGVYDLLASSLTEMRWRGEVNIQR